MTAGDSARALAAGHIRFLLASVLQDAMIIESRTAKLAAQKKPVLRSGCNLADRLQSCLLHRRPRAAYFCITARCARILLPRRRQPSQVRPPRQNK